MNFKIIRPVVLLRYLLTMLMVFSLLLLPPLIFALFTGETFMIRPFLIPFLSMLIPGLPCAIYTLRKQDSGLHRKEGFLLVSLSWFCFMLLGALPYYLSPRSLMGESFGLASSIFESAGALATTGVSALENVEILPRSLLLFQALTHWAGGMGIILLTVALMPLLGVGSFQLIKAEGAGVDRDRITPRITGTAKFIWICYSLMTVVLILLYMAGGMDPFDAFFHACTTMASGGVSTRNRGFAFYQSSFIEAVTIVFMILSTINFNLYYRLSKGRVKDVLDNTELKAYGIILLVSSLLLTLFLTPYYGSPLRALRYGAFQGTSILSTTGAVITDFSLWPPAAQGLLLALSCIGGCSGSTAGGIKVIRWVVLWRQGGNEIKRIVFPQGIFSVRLNNKVGRKDVVYGVAGYVFLYAALVFACTLLTAWSGIDLWSSFCASLAVTGNTGILLSPAHGALDYSIFSDSIKLLFSFAMLAGRLELWTIFILLTPEFWRR